MNRIKSEDNATYNAHATDQDIIAQALAIIERNLGGEKDILSAPKTVSKYLVIKLAGLQHEIFGCIYLNNRNQVLNTEELFRGTIDGASVYPREVVKAVLRHNASSVIFYHNHPSGSPEPSRADEIITNRLQDALKLIDVRVLDHLIIGGIDTVSFAERGLI